MAFIDKIYLSVDLKCFLDFIDFNAMMPTDTNEWHVTGCIFTWLMKIQFNCFFCDFFSIELFLSSFTRSYDSRQIMKLRNVLLGLSSNSFMSNREFDLDWGSDCLAKHDESDNGNVNKYGIFTNLVICYFVFGFLILINSLCNAYGILSWSFWNLYFYYTKEQCEIDSMTQNFFWVHSYI